MAAHHGIASIVRSLRILNPSHHYIAHADDRAVNFTAAVMLLAGLRFEVLDAADLQLDRSWRRCLETFQFYQHGVPSARHAVVTLQGIKEQILQSQGRAGHGGGPGDPSATQSGLNTSHTAAALPTLDSTDTALPDEMEEFLNSLEDLPDDWFGSYLNELVS